MASQLVKGEAAVIGLPTTTSLLMVPDNDGPNPDATGTMLPVTPSMLNVNCCNKEEDESSSRAVLVVSAGAAGASDVSVDSMRVDPPTTWDTSPVTADFDAGGAPTFASCVAK
jgi:hypothetical protein